MEGARHSGWFHGERVLLEVVDGHLYQRARILWEEPEDTVGGDERAAVHVLGRYGRCLQFDEPFKARVVEVECILCNDPCVSVLVGVQIVVLELVAAHYLAGCRRQTVHA